MLESFHKYPVFPDLLENQRRSIKFFWEKGILDELELFSTILGYTKEKAIEKSIQVSGTGKTQKTVSPSLSKSPGLGPMISDRDKNKRSDELGTQNISNVHFFKGFLSSQKARRTYVQSSGQASYWKPTEANFFGPLRFLKFPIQNNRRSREIKSNKKLTENLKTQKTKYQKKQTQFTSQSVSQNRRQKILKLAGSERFWWTNAQMDLKRKSANIQKNIASLYAVEPDFLVLHGSKFVLKAPYYSQNQAIQYQKTYSVGLFLPVSQKSARQNGGNEGHPGRTQPESRRFNQSTDRKLSRAPTDKGSPRGKSHPNLPRTQNFSAIDSGKSLVENQQKVWFYFGDIPLMTDRGSFIINGAPRVLVNQIIRCPSVYFKVKLDQKNRRTYIASFLSEYGSWLRLETDRLGKRIWARIDKSPRFPAELLLLGLGYTEKGPQEQSRREAADAADRRSGSRSSPRQWAPTHANLRRPYAGRAAELRERNHHRLGFKTDVFERPQGSATRPSSASDRQAISPEVSASAGPSVSLRRSELRSRNQGSPASNNRQLMRKLRDGKNTEDTKKIVSTSAGVALQTIWKKCNPGRWTSSLGCYSFFYNKFLNPKRYSIGRVGRLRLNKRLLRNPECCIPTLTPEDILLAFNYLRQLRSSDIFTIRNSSLELDDIDHLKNRRVRLPGEILQNQFRLALSRITWSALRFQNQGLTAGSDQMSFAANEPNPSKDLRSSTDQRSGRELRSSAAAAFGSRSRDLRSFGPSVGRAGRPGPSAGRGAGPLHSSGHENNVFQVSGETPPQAFNLVGKSENYGPAIPAFQNTLRELFNTGQLSQYMDQTNPLAEITHKRRLSSLGPGGVGRDQAGFAVREIHPSHFGRICPIETPEGQNAGLVGSLASYARINGDGFLQSPCLPIETKQSRVASGPKSVGFQQTNPMEETKFYQRTKGPETFGRGGGSRTFGQSQRTFGRPEPAGGSQRSGRLKISLFSSELEDEIYVCTGDTLNPISRKPNKNGSLIFDVEQSWTNPPHPIGPRPTESHEGSAHSFPQFPNVFPVRYKQEFVNMKKTDALKLTDAPTKLFTGVCPIQLISIATSLIPFLEHDDANRALMGSNMQRQAVPFLLTEKPFVGTGLELQAARDSSTLVLAKQSGQVIFLDSNFIEIQSQDGDGWGFPSQRKKTRHSYSLTNFLPSNQSTCLKQKPAVEIGEWVERGSLLADGAGTKDGEVTLGKNVLLAYMPWEGYNFEDAIVINERLVFEDIYTSIHVERFDVDIKNTKILCQAEPPGPCNGISVEERSPPPTGGPVEHAGPAGGISLARPDAETAFRGFAGQMQPEDQRSRLRPSAAAEGGFVGQSTAMAGLKYQKSTKSSFLRIDQIAAGEYLTSDLDLFTLKVDKNEAQQNQSRGTDLRGSMADRLTEGPASAPRNESLKAGLTGSSTLSLNGIPTQNGSFRSRSKSLQHLDNNGIVKPGTWVQEGDILVGKIQLGGSADQRSGVSESVPASRETGFAQYGTLAEKTPTLPSNSRNLPFPEYRLLLAIFELQNPRSGTESRVDKMPSPGTASSGKKVLESEMLGTKSDDGDGATDRLPDLRSAAAAAASTTAAVGEGRSRMVPSTNVNNARSSTVLRTAQVIQNTSAKVGIGVKGRVLDCLFDGNFVGWSPANSVLETDQRSVAESHRTFGTEGPGPRFVQKSHNCSYVSVFLAHKKRIQLGDKMSGRHGNKGIVSLILSPQDMPYLQDGKPIDVVLNPLGVPSRMNVGQVLETLFGLSAFYLQKIYRILPFDERLNPRVAQHSSGGGCQTPPRLQELPSAENSLPPRPEAPFGPELRSSEDLRSFGGGPPAETSRSLVYGYLRDLRKTLKGRGDWLFDPNNPGKTHVFDGRTGENFYQPVLVGYSYMFKLIHLVDDKIHARSTGPYSLVTQQPLGGRSKKGGQRLGEMEVWALQGFGTASILQEFLTVKSDEIYSRNHFLFHLMRRNWESLEKIPQTRSFASSQLPDRLTEGPASATRISFGRDVRSSPEDLRSFGWGQRSSGSTGGLEERMASGNGPSVSSGQTLGRSEARLPESFRVLMNELHALCLSVYSNLPN